MLYYENNSQLKSLTLLPLWVASFLCFFFVQDSTRIKPLSVPQLSTVILSNRGTDNGLTRVESEKTKHRKEETHNGNKVRLFN